MMLFIVTYLFHNISGGYSCRISTLTRSVKLCTVSIRAFPERLGCHVNGVSGCLKVSSRLLVAIIPLQMAKFNCSCA